MVATNRKRVAPARQVHPRGALRVSVIKRSLENALHSNVAYLFVLLVVSLISVIHFKKHLFLLVIPLAFVVTRWKILLFDFMLIVHSTEATLGTFTWFSNVDNSLYLGGLPVDQMGHKDVLLHKYKITAIVSVLEDFELTSRVLVGKMIDMDDMKRHHEVSHLVLRTPDMVPPPFSVLDDGANFINRHLSEGGAVYCHCKSGVGRSASVIVAYFMKYKRLTLVEAHSEVKLMRPWIFSRTSRQYRHMVEYEKYLRKPYKQGN